MRIFRGKFLKVFAVFTVVQLLAQTLAPTAVYALTSGPSAPEVQSFSPAGTSDMVNLFTGDFNYNIPLFELPGPNGGYPFNLAYNAGIGMDQEASWVGLRWNLNPGAINRQMRGLPDEFCGDEITKTEHLKPNLTYGFNLRFPEAEVIGATTEELQKAAESTQTSLTPTLGIYHNNYNGFGYKAGMQLGVHSAKTSKIDAGVDLGLAFDSQGGLGVNASLSFDKMKEERDQSGNLMSTATTSHSIGLGYNSNQGLTDMSVGVSSSKNELEAKKNEKGMVIGYDDKISNSKGSIPISLSSSGYSPSVNSPRTGVDVTLTVKLGGSLDIAFLNGPISGYFTKEELLYNGEPTKHNAYGYLHMGEAANKDVYSILEEVDLALRYNSSMLDFNREKDGMITPENPGLAIPSLTYDIYSASGQGFSAMYRAFRNDLGIVHDPSARSSSMGGEIGFDFSVPSGKGDVHIPGLNLSVNSSESISGIWGKNGKDKLEVFGFVDETTTAPDQAAVFFKNYGETTTDPSDELEKLLTSQQLEAGGHVIGLSGQKIQGDGLQGITKEELLKRRPTNAAIVPITNRQLIDDSGDEAYSAFRIGYTDCTGCGTDGSGLLKMEDGKAKKYNRADHPQDHMAGFLATKGDGLRYVYALPAYNNEQADKRFSVKAGDLKKQNQRKFVNELTLTDIQAQTNTDQYYSETETPEYAHAYMLTSILGSDYVDADNIPGPSDGDLGYWVKFHYVKTENEFHWRAPYIKANYMAGSWATMEDDKASSTSGTKEVWYLQRAETKSHVAEFHLKQRDDMREAPYGEVNKLTVDFQTNAARSYGLDRIVLRSKLEGDVPIKTVHFDYDYSLCKNTWNNFTTWGGTEQNPPTDNCDLVPIGVAGSGKLTLKRVYFTYGNNVRGKLNPYEFEYETFNPNYDLNQYDRWGNYKKLDAGHEGKECGNNHVDPYVNQAYFKSDGSEEEEKLKDIHLYASAWCLKRIGLPSGGAIVVDYESDDYAYVQERPAMQMTKIEGCSSVGDSVLDNNSLSLVFRLERPIPVASSPDFSTEIAKYLDLNTNYHYFKARIKLRPGRYDLVAGYVKVNHTDPGNELISLPNSDHYTHAKIILHSFKKRLNAYNPISVAAWQHLQTNLPKLATEPWTSENGPSNVTEEQIVSQIKSIFGSIPTIKQMISGFYTYANNRGWGRTLDLDKAWIRLKSPDGKKYGGGHRVRQLTLFDNWEQMDKPSGKERIYGQVYDYTIQEDGYDHPISSGVAAYEPMIGGDENPLRLPKEYKRARMLKNNNNLYFEYPVNESYFPGPSVGYRKVTVMSLASATKAGSDRVGESDGIFIPAGFNGGTTGATVHEFYTAKDFPTVTGMRDKQESDPLKVIVPIPYVGTTVIDRYAASQGYKVTLNDMHGKPKKVSNYAQDREGNIIANDEKGADAALSWVRYNYKHNKIAYIRDGTINPVMINVLDSRVTTLEFENGRLSGTDDRNLGMDYEFFADLRESQSKSFGLNGRFNVDITNYIFAVIPWPSWWPVYNVTQTRARTAVTNLIVHQIGIMESTEAYDGGSLVVTTNEYYDQKTGTVLVTSVDNDYGDKIYNMSIPAHSQYPRMGQASENVGMEFAMQLVEHPELADRYIGYLDAEIEDKVLFIEGDELLVGAGQGTATYLGQTDEGRPFFASRSALAGEHQCYIYRSGNRNLLSANVGSLTILKDDPVQAILSSPVQSDTKIFKLPVKVTGSN